MEVAYYYGILVLERHTYVRLRDRTETLVTILDSVSCATHQPDEITHQNFL